MTTTLAIAQPDVDARDPAARLWELISSDFLEMVRWSNSDRTIRVPRVHPLLGWNRRLPPPDDQLQDPDDAVREGSCPVRGCPRDRTARSRYCPHHHARWIWARRLDPDVDEAAWRADPDAVEPTERVVVLSGLPPLLVAQILYGLQTRCRKGSHTSWQDLDLLCRRARDRGVQAIDQLSPGTRDHVTATIQTAVRRALLHPDTERLKDTWDMTVFGLGGYLDFTGISQPWLREAVKRWAFDYLPTRNGSKVTGAVQARITAVARLSGSLRLQRDDGGADHTRLSASDITAFCNRMAFLQDSGEVSARLRLYTCRMVKTVVDGFRVLGLTRAGQCLAGLPDDFALRRGQIPDEWDDDEAGKDLPAEIMRVVCDSLPLLEQRCGAEARTAVELLIDTGRRPGEICQLRFDCLEYDTDNQPVDVLRELMDHRRMDTTQRYYNVGHQRRCEAIDRVAHMQFDRRGARIWRNAQALLDDERVRLAVGEVAVPYGGCSEPSNVSAGGSACPIRFRCVGCGHFRTDASYLPDLEAYLADLLRNRERILAAMIDADDWARQEAFPSDEEITRVRRLVDRIKAELDDLTPQERAEIEQAVAVVRRGRVLLRITPTPQRSLCDLRPERAS